MMNNNETQQNGYPTCRYNLGVVCSPAKRNCGACGWCPEVEKKRLIRIFNGKTQLVRGKR